MMTSSDRININWVVRVGLASCGIAAGGRKVYDTFRSRLQGRPDVELKQTGCLGMCYNEVLVEVSSVEGEHVFYKQVTHERVERIVAEHLIEGRPVAEWVIPADELDNLLAKQKRIVLRNCGVIDPESIDEYESVGGYRATQKALVEMTPEQIIQQIKDSGLRGRGGAGFPTGLKWSFTANNKSDIKYVVCNADEGDPGAFMDRSVLEGDPHSILEGMIICGKAIGSSFGYIYCRAEYPLAVHRLEIAIAQAREKGFLGSHIFGSDFDFDLQMNQGAGAFVCGRRPH